MGQSGSSSGNRRPPMSKFTVAWIIWVAWFIFWEGWALLDRARGDTLSEYVWLLRNKGGTFVAFMLAGFLCWLLWHFIVEGR